MYFPTVKKPDVLFLFLKNIDAMFLFLSILTVNIATMLLNLDPDSVVNNFLVLLCSRLNNKITIIIDGLRSLFIWSELS